MKVIIESSRLERVWTAILTTFSLGLFIRGHCLAEIDGYSQEGLVKNDSLNSLGLSSTQLLHSLSRYICIVDRKSCLGNQHASRCL